MKTIISIHENEVALDSVVAQFITELAAQKIKENGVFRIALSGGTTPRRLYQMLSKKPFCDQLEWSKLLFFWGDERYVAHTDPQSNFRMVKEVMLDLATIPPENIFPIPYLATPEESAAAYAQTLKTSFSTLPRFDLVLLGIGQDGHTASLFPGSASLNETEKWVTTSKQEGNVLDRITLTYPVINNAEQIVFIVTGPEKAHIVFEILEKKTTSLPAACINPQNGKVIWHLDQGAARSLSPTYINSVKG